MDPKKEKINAPPQNVQPPMQPLNTPQQPAQPVTGAENPYYDQQVQPGQVIGYGLPTDQQVYGTPKPQPPSKIKLAIIGFVMLAFLLAVVGGAVYGISKIGKKPSNQANSSQQEQIGETEEINVEVPEDWETLDTGFGFSVRAPSGWEKGSGDDNSDDKFESEISTLTPTSQEESGDGGTSDVSQQTTITRVGTIKLKNSQSQSDFESTITNADQYKAKLAEDLDFKAEEVKVSSKKLKINGNQEWIQVDIEAPGVFSRYLYLWDNDHALLLAADDLSTDKAKFEDHYKQYILPMAASVIFDDAE